MTNVPKELKLAAQRAYGPEKTRPIKLRILLSWFGAQRRGVQVASDIRSALKKVKLATEPDFMTANIEDRVRLVPTGKVNVVATKPQLPNTTTKTENRVETVAPLADGKEPTLQLTDPTPRLGTVFGGQAPVSVRRDDTIKRAMTIMLKHDYSQLPVMSSSKQVEGLISWKSIGKEVNVQNKGCEQVKDCIDTDVEILRWDRPLWEAIKTIADKDVVLIKDKTNDIVGIVTCYDLANQYHTLNEPFFLLGEIENNLRQLAVKADFPIATLEAAKDPKDTKRTVTGVDKLTFGELVRLLDSEQNWARIHLKLSRTAFLSDIRKIVKIRNDVMHFSPDPLDKASLKTLQDAAKMFRGLKLFENEN